MRQNWRGGKQRKSSSRNRLLLDGGTQIVGEIMKFVIIIFSSAIMDNTPIKRYFQITDVNNLNI